jgi:hypothetical protein
MGTPPSRHPQGPRRGWLLLPAAVALACMTLVGLTACTVQIGTVAPTPTGPGTTVHITIAHGPQGSTLVLLPVTINNQGPFTFALDTGASQSLIDRPLARRLGLQPTGAPTPISGVGGQEEAVPVRLSHWHVEQITLPPATISAASLFNAQRDSGMQGLVGSDIWNQFGKITIDYDASTLTVYRQFTSDERALPLSPARILTAEARARWPWLVGSAA